MRVLVIGGLQGEAITLDNVRGLPQLYSYYFRREFERAGHEVVSCNCGGASLRPQDSQDYYSRIQIPEADHAICVEQRAFANRDEYFYDAMRAKVKGRLATMADNPVILGPEDITFYTVPDPEPPKTRYVGWAADAALLSPIYTGRHRVLIDHAHYGQRPGFGDDDSPNVVAQCKELMKDRPNVDVRLIGNSGVVDLHRSYQTERYDRSASVAYPAICQEYQRTDVFVVTHGESMGLSVLEAAMAGAVVVAPYAYIRPRLLDGLVHVTYQPGGVIPWEKVFAKTDRGAVRERALFFNRWDDMCGIILRDLERGVLWTSGSI